MTDKPNALIPQREADELFPVSSRTRLRLQQRGIYPLPALRLGNRLFYSRQVFLQALERLAKPDVTPGAAAIEAASFLGKKGSR
jgi:hypothetical protein